MGRRGCPPEFRRKVGGPGRGGPLSRRPRPGSPTLAPTRASSSASPQPGSRPPPTGSICSGSRTAGRLSTGAGRIRSASSCNLASCPDRPPPPSVPAPRKIGFELTSWPSRTSSRVRWVRPRPPRELNSDRRHKSGRERPTIAVHRRIGCGHARKRLRAFSLDNVTALDDPTTR
jgi:hypothetical protein